MITTGLAARVIGKRQYQWKRRGSAMKLIVRALALFVPLALCAPSADSQEMKLPPQVTPALRAACETDVRRLCIGENPTVDAVKSCVKRRFGELSMRCKVQIAAAGLTPAGR